MRDDKACAPCAKACKRVLNAHFGARIVAARRAYVKKLNECAEEIYNGLASGKEAFELTYLTDLPQEYVEDALVEALKNAFSTDLSMGFTTVGPHREDMDVKVDRISARAYGSQGQQRSAVLAMKLAEAKLLQIQPMSSAATSMVSLYAHSLIREWKNLPELQPFLSSMH